MKKQLFVLIGLACALFAKADNFAKPMEKFEISSYFGYRKPVMGGTGDHLRLHRGIDMVGPKNSPIRAVKSGEVVEHWPAPNGFFKGHPIYGGLVVIDHGDGEMTLYAHMKATYVKEGEWIEQSEIIGIQGSTGRSTGDHLHFEVLTDPLAILQED